MFCERCGKELRDGAKFCSRCGALVEQKEMSEQETELQKPDNQKSGKQKKEKKSEKQGKAGKSRKPGLRVLLFIILAVVMCGIGICLWQYEKNKDYLTSIKNYEAVNNSILTYAKSDEYLQLKTEEKAEHMLDLLQELESMGEIDAESVEYDQENQIICYTYADGSYGGVMLEDFEEGAEGNGAYSYVTAYDADGLVSEISHEVSFEVDTYPYEQQELSAVIMYGLDNDVQLEKLKMQQKLWTKEYLQTDLDEECSVSDFKENLAGYDLIVIREHGCVYRNSITIFLTEKPSFSVTVYGGIKLLNYGLKAEDIPYIIELKANRVGQVFDPSDLSFHYILFPEFISYHYAENGLQDSIVWLGCCDGYRNDSFVKAFADCGAKAVLGWTESVDSHYNTLMSDAFVYMLLYGNTVEESACFAKSIWGNNDKIYSKNYYDFEDEDPAELRFYNGGEETLVTLTQGAVEYLEQSKEYAEGEQEEVTTANEECDAQALKDILLEQFTEDEILDFCAADFDYNGEMEAFALIKSGEDYEGYFGRIYYINQEGIQIVHNDEKELFDIYEDNLLEFSGAQFYIVGKYYTTEDRTYVFGVKNGEWYEDDLSLRGMALGQLEDSDDLGIIESVYDYGCDGTGHTYKPYYLYWDNGFHEYGGIQISTADFLCCKGAEEVYDQIIEKGCNITSIIYYANEMIRINYTDGEWNYNATLLMEEDSVTLVQVNEYGEGVLEQSDYGGIYKEAFLEDIAVYPSSFPVTANNKEYTLADKEWASAYLETFFCEGRELDTSAITCCLMYVNDDQIPELWIDYGYGYLGEIAGTVSGDTVNSFKAAYGFPYWIERENLLLISGGHMGVNYDQIYKVENGQFVLIENGVYGQSDTSKALEYDDNDEPIYDMYLWNDVVMTKNEYQEYLNCAFDKNQALNYLDFTQNLYTYEQCRQLLQTIAE